MRSFNNKAKAMATFLLPVVLVVLIFVIVMMAVPFLFAIIGYAAYNWPLRMSFWSHMKDEYERAYFLLFS